MNLKNTGKRYMSKIVLLGANGQLGNDIKKVFKESDTKLIPLTREDLDAEKDDVNKKLERFRGTDYLINTIAYNKVDDAEDFIGKAFKTNSFFVYKLSKFCTSNDVTLIHISTDYVFDGKKNEPYKETDLPNPLNVYGNSKLAGEFFVRNYCEKYFIFRISSLFGIAGSRGKGGNFVETMIKLAKENKPLKIISNQYMSPTHTLDVARTIKTFIDKDINEYGIYHACNTGLCSWHEFAKTIFEFTNIKANLSEITYEDYKTKAKRPKYSVMDNTRVSKYYKMPEWEEALKEYLVEKGLMVEE